MKYNIKGTKFGLTLYQKDAISLILTDAYLLNEFVTKEKVPSYVTNHAKYAAEHLYGMCKEFIEGNGHTVIYTNMSIKELRMVHSSLQEYKNKYKIDFISDKVLYKFRCIIEVRYHRNDLVVQFAEQLIQALNKAYINTYVYHAESSNSIYIKPDSGLLRTIRISDHAPFEYEDFQQRYCVVCSKTPDEFRRVTKYNNNKESVQMTTVGKNGFEEAVHRIKLSVIKEKEEKCQTLSDIIYHRCLSSNMKDNTTFKKVKTLYK